MGTLLLAGLCLFMGIFSSISPGYAGTQPQNPAQSLTRSTDFPLPRFVSLRSHKIHARTGPALRYPVRWVYARKNLPVEIIREYDTWRRIRDHAGGEGWVHESLISGRRTALVIEDSPAPLYRRPESGAPVLARLEQGVVADMEECTPAWCMLSVQGFRGWVSRKSLWGIYPGEELD
jgi:SH3-like domain-containing protein